MRVARKPRNPAFYIIYSKSGCSSHSWLSHNGTQGRKTPMPPSSFPGRRGNSSYSYVILMVNPILLAGYTFGCHAFRHLAAGRLDCFACPNGQQKMRYKLWKGISWLNGRHMFWAWVSMIWVVIADVYVRLVSMGIWTDLNTWGN